jgi:C_GCAxxG_C_C family probable redox protein
MELFRQGYNCSQSVLGAFCEEMNLDQETAFRLSSSFGGGMGRLREVCGAVSGMFMVAGLKYGYADAKDHQKKKELYRRIQELAGRFQKENGSIICRELLGLSSGPDDPAPEKRTEAYYRKRPCVELVGCAAEIIAQAIQETEKEENEKMKVIIPVETCSIQAPVCPSFGRSPFFACCDTETGSSEFLTNSAAESQGGAGIQAAQFITDSGAGVLITYRCGKNAADVLQAAGIQILKAHDGSAEENIAKYKSGELSPLTQIHAGFHHQGGTAE